MDKKIKRMKEICLQQTGTNPVQIAKSMMHDEAILIHGPEHHILDGAAFLRAMHNAGVEFDFDAAFEEMVKRGLKMPGATCGQWGVCGSASSAGAALAILHNTGPLSDNENYKDNLRLTSRILDRIADIGGPRCCKRNAFISLQTVVEFMKERFDIELDMEEITCEFSNKNQQCIGTRCPFHKPKVAFVCVHNSCRSQMAEALGKHFASEVFESYSAGTETKPQINQDAVRIMKELYGIDMEETQHSKLLEDIPQVDIVVTMGCNVQCPFLPCQHREDWGLEDPSGKSDEEFIKTAKMIESKIHSLMERISRGELTE